jgi:small subunit ribosomal protein S13
MAKANAVEYGEDFQYQIRLAATDLDGTRPIGMAMTAIRGVGLRASLALCDIAQLSPQKLAGMITTEEQDALKAAIEGYPTRVPLWMLNRQRDPESGDELHLFSQDSALVQKDDIDRLRAIKCYRGVFHARGKKVRGQRTRSNGRRGLTLGVKLKK